MCQKGQHCANQRQMFLVSSQVDYYYYFIIIPFFSQMFSEVLVFIFDYDIFEKYFFSCSFLVNDCQQITVIPYSLVSLIFTGYSCSYFILSFSEPALLH